MKREVKRQIEYIDPDEKHINREFSYYNEYRNDIPFSSGPFLYEVWHGVSKHYAFSAISFLGTWKDDGYHGIVIDFTSK